MYDIYAVYHLYDVYDLYIRTLYNVHPLLYTLVHDSPFILTT